MEDFTIYAIKLDIFQALSEREREIEKKPNTNSPSNISELTSRFSTLTACGMLRWSLWIRCMPCVHTIAYLVLQ